MRDERNDDVGSQGARDPKRRQFSAEYKRRIVREAALGVETGALGALLRREGLSSSHSSKWREQVERGEIASLLARKPGPKAQPVDPRAGSLATTHRRAVLACPLRVSS